MVKLIIRFVCRYKEKTIPLLSVFELLLNYTFLSCFFCKLALNKFDYFCSDKKIYVKITF